jgi:hypothetical protein
LRIRDAYPGSRIHQELKIGRKISKHKNKLVVLPFFIVINLTKFKVFELAQKKILSQLPKKWLLCSQKYGVFGSEVRDPEKLIPDPDLQVENHRIVVPGSGFATLFVNNDHYHYRYPYLIRNVLIVITLVESHTPLCTLIVLVTYLVMLQLFHMW